MMMESRPRVSKRALLFGAVAVGAVTFVVLIAEGIFTFGAKTSHVEHLAQRKDKSAEVNAAAVDRTPEKSDSSSSSSTQAKRDDGRTDNNNNNSPAGETTRKNDARTSLSGATDSDGAETCRTLGDGVVVNTSKCRPCGEPEKQHISDCAETGRVEQTVTCLGGKPTKRKHRACFGAGAAEEEERKFIVFEAVNFGVGIAAYVVVLLRRKKLDSALAKKIQQQLASGV